MSCKDRCRARAADASLGRLRDDEAPLPLPLPLGWPLPLLLDAAAAAAAAAATPPVSEDPETGVPAEEARIEGSMSEDRGSENEGCDSGGGGEGEGVGAAMGEGDACCVDSTIRGGSGRCAPSAAYCSQMAVHMARSPSTPKLHRARSRPVSGGVWFGAAAGAVAVGRGESPAAKIVPRLGENPPAERSRVRRLLVMQASSSLK